MLTKAVEHLNSFGIIPIIKDDGSTYDIKLPNYFRHAHRGKKEYWKTWKEMFNECGKDEPQDLYIFMPDDFQDLDVDRVRSIHRIFTKEGAYVYNIINDGRTKEWTGIKEQKYSKTETKVGFTDCGFFCNYETLKKLRFDMLSILDSWWLKGDNVSSGVGRQLSARITQLQIPIYKPVKSLAFHGEHESKMHKEERIKNPLISK